MLKVLTEIAAATKRLDRDGCYSDTLANSDCFFAVTISITNSSRFGLSILVMFVRMLKIILL